MTPPLCLPISETESIELDAIFEQSGEKVENVLEEGEKIGIGEEHHTPFISDPQCNHGNSVEWNSSFDGGSKDDFELRQVQNSLEVDDSGSDQGTNLQHAQKRNYFPSGQPMGHSSSEDPNFIQNYFKVRMITAFAVCHKRIPRTFLQYSRLHFIGTWRNRYAGRGPSSASSCGPEPLTEGSRTILHLDMDCFFVSVAVRNRADLVGKPIAVSHSDSSRGTAEISSANYEARKYGVRAGMFMREAKVLCPSLAVVDYDFEGYEEVAERVVSILFSHSAVVQVLSCDEALLDISGLGDAEGMAQEIRSEILQSTGCPASAGIGPNPLLARLATRRAKPNGQFRVLEDEVGACPCPSPHTQGGGQGESPPCSPL